MTKVNCGKFDELLAGYLEGELTDERVMMVETHARECAACGTVLADVRAITAQAAALPLITPSRDLWSGIEQRISAPVIPLQSSTDQTWKFPSRYGRMAAAAAALIVTTAGITYLATAHSVAKQVPARVQVASAPVVVDSAPVSQTVETPTTSSKQSTLASRDASRGATAAVASAAPNPALTQADAAYSKEISALELIAKQRHSTLDPLTVAIIQRNLEIIDRAIAQSKDALAHDPGSSLLYDQLMHSFDKKVQLLKTVASLPSTT